MNLLKSVTFVVAGSLFAAGCHSVEGKESAPVRPVKAMNVQSVETMTRARYAVTIEPDLEVGLAFKVSGYVDQIPERRGADGRMRPLQEGDLVQAGARLALVREAEYRERVNQANSAVREAEAMRVKAGHDWERAKTLFASLSLTRPDLDAATASYESAQARSASAAAEAQLATIALADCSIESPFSGVVLERKIEVGNLIGSGTMAFRIGRVSSVKAVFGVPDTIVSRIATGMAFDVTTEALAPDTFKGRVTAISPAADPDAHIFNVEVTIPNGDGRLRPGMVGAVEIQPQVAAETASFPVVPLTSIVRSASNRSEYAVFVVERRGDAEMVHARNVRLGTASGNMMTVTSGLSDGDRVVTMGAGLLKDQEQVRVIP